MPLNNSFKQANKTSHYNFLKPSSKQFFKTTRIKKPWWRGLPGFFQIRRPLASKGLKATTFLHSTR